MGGCFVQTAAGRRCSSRLRRWIPYMITMGFEPMTSLARTQPLLKQRGERPAHLPDPLCARPAPARPTHAMSSAGAVHVHVHIPQEDCLSPDCLSPAPGRHLRPPDGKGKPPDATPLECRGIALPGNHPTISVRDR